MSHKMKQSKTQDQTGLWSSGWYRFATHVASPNFGPRPPETLIELIVIHSISLPPGRYGGDEVALFFTNRLDWNQHPYFKSIEGMQVSSHFFINRRGELLQFVNAQDRAWHAGASHHRGRSNCNDYSVGIELEGLEGDTFEDEQYETLAALCAALLQRYPIRALAGHEHIAPGRKTDPGAGFNWQRLQKGLGLSARYFPDGV
jgi:N-acetyl-anhydromuramoyl-L-alanine amidase